MGAIAVQAVLASRIDRLPAEEKELLQTLALLGREFRLGLVQRVTRKPEDELERRLSQLLEHRKLLHDRAGLALESMFAEQLDDHLDELAHHYSRSDNVGKAVEYLGRAGQQALQRSAHNDALRSLGATIDLLHKLPDSPKSA